MRDFLKWLCSEGDGHFALIVIALGATAAAWLAVYLAMGLGPASPIAVAVGMTFQAFIQKVRS